MKAKENWKPVTISGFTGIMLGAGAMYGTEKLMANHEDVIAESEELAEESAVNDEMSFKEAFEAARAEQGPGGIFHWRGGVYGTYYADEWNAMSDEEKNQFAQSVKTGANTDDDTNLLADDTTGDVDDVTSDVASTPDPEDDTVTVTVVKDDEEEVAVVDNTDDDDVRVIGYGDVAIGDGQYVTVEELDINGQRVAVIDVDKDGVGDFAMSDLNHNNRPDEGEIIDLHTGDVVSFDNQASMDNTDSNVDDVIDIMPA